MWRQYWEAWLDIHENVKAKRAAQPAAIQIAIDKTVGREVGRKRQQQPSFFLSPLDVCRKMDKRIASFGAPSFCGPTISAPGHQSGEAAPDPTEFSVPRGGARMAAVWEAGVSVFLQREKRQREDERAAEVRHHLQCCNLQRQRGEMLRENDAFEREAHLRSALREQNPRSYKNVTGHVRFSFGSDFFLGLECIQNYLIMIYSTIFMHLHPSTCP